jgi:hypothetical protein
VPTESVTGTADAAVQTLFRESEAQTDPFTPEVTLNASKPTPEVLMLEGMTFERGLPAGLTEVKMVELARKRRAAEDALPPSTDEASVALRMGLLEALETAEFDAREADIDDFQAKRLAALSVALAERDRANAFNGDVRVDLLRQQLVEKRDKASAKVATQRLTAMRKVDGARAKALPAALMKVFDGSTKKRDVVALIANPSSNAFAPVRRDGADRNGDASPFDLHRVVLPPASPGALRAFSGAAPASLRRAVIPQPRLAPDIPAANPAARAERRMQQDLELVSTMIAKEQSAHLLATGGARSQTASQAGASQAGGAGGAGDAATGGGTEGAGGGDMPAWFAKPRVDRPPTPTVPDLAEDVDAVAAEEAAAGARLLQRLLRGRAAQNRMFVGRAQRAELIAELRASAGPGIGAVAKHAAVASGALDAMSGGRVSYALAEGTGLIAKEVAAAEAIAQAKADALAAEGLGPGGDDDAEGGGAVGGFDQSFSDAGSSVPVEAAAM